MISSILVHATPQNIHPRLHKRYILSQVTIFGIEEDIFEKFEIYSAFQERYMLREDIKPPTRKCSM